MSEPSMQELFANIREQVRELRDMDLVPAKLARPARRARTVTAKLIRDAEKAGKSVKVTRAPDGTETITVGAPEPADSNEWDREFNGQPRS